MFNIDKMSRTPIYGQIIEQFERAVITGEYGGGKLLPSVRELAVKLSVNPNTLQKAYTELERRGLCHSVPGSGRFVSPDAAEKLRGMKRGLISDVERLVRELRLSGISEDEMIAVVLNVYHDERK
ncbi:MAG: GntR family transcriptional regulator [Christensenellaceae bacterium]|nr:GntR family transcriptional regulator [Christensenellaceae bacterium]